MTEEREGEGGGDDTKKIPRILRDFVLMKAGPTHDESGRVQHKSSLTKDDRDWKERAVKIGRGKRERERETGDDAVQVYLKRSQGRLTLMCSVLIQ